MKHKILPIFLCFVIVFSLFAFSVSAADDDILIPAGTYTFYENVDTSVGVSAYIPFATPTFYGTADGESVSVSYNGERILVGSYENVNAVFFTGDIVVNGVSDPLNLTPYTDSYGWNSTSNDLGLSFLNDFGRTIVILEDTLVSNSFGLWFGESTTGGSPSLPELPSIDSGYYRLILPIDLAEPTWIGDRTTVWYNLRGRVITEDSNRALSFYRLGVRYFVNEGEDYGAGVWGIELRIDTNSETNVEIMQITFDRNSNTFYWSYNDLVLDSFVGLAIDGDYEVTGDFLSLFDSLFEPYDYEYTGNPWYDIIDGVVDALKIDVFGDFSPWDILVTFIGISVFIWLLKVLAGG